MRLCLTVGVLLVTNACAVASNPSNVIAAEPDTAKMAFIEHQATRMGIQVFWIHPPLKMPARPNS